MSLTGHRIDQSYILCLLTTFARLCFFVARYLLLGVAVKKQIFSVSQITDIEQYFAFVFTHATETSILLKIKKDLNLVKLVILV